MNTRSTTHSQSRRRIGIIGGGASSALYAIECHRRLGTSVELMICDSSPDLGRGRAYAGPDRNDLLNVPAAQMSVYSDQPDDFVQWLKSTGRVESSFPHWPYVNRAVFGDYLSERLKSVPFTHLRERVVAVEKDGAHFELTLESQATVTVDAVVVATGYRSEDLARDFSALIPVQDRVITSLAGLSRCQKSDEVLIIGTGLTAIDFWKRLRVTPEIQVDFLSRRGLFPLAHEHAPLAVQIPRLEAYSPARMLAFIRKFRNDTQSSWPSVAIAIRAQVTTIWSTWSDRERRRFIRHLKPYWEVIRHRVPAGVRADLDSDLQSGRVLLHAGRVKSARAIGGRVELEVRLRNTNAIQTLSFDRIILAIGAPIDQDLTFSGFEHEISRCPFGQGYRGKTGSDLWFLGPPARSLVWEITALPDIREQVKRIVGEIEHL